MFISPYMDIQDITTVVYGVSVIMIHANIEWGKEIAFSKHKDVMLGDD